MLPESYRQRIERNESEDNVLSQVTDAAPEGAAVEGGLMAALTDGSSMTLLDSILQSLDEEKAEDIVTIELAGKSEMADYMVVASGRSSRQVAAIAEKLVDRIKADFSVYSKIEGKGTGDWVLIDAGDVIVHVFRPEVREFYQIEKMWAASGKPTQDA